MQLAASYLQKAQTLVATSQMGAAVAELEPCLRLCLQNLENASNADTTQDIETYRKGNLNVSVVDSKGKAIPNAQISYQQTTHDFQFGANPLGANGAYDATVVQTMKAAGFNQTCATVRWGLIETSPGTFNWSNIDEQQRIDSLISQGFKILGALALWTTPITDFTPQYIHGLSFDKLTASVDSFAYALAKRYSGKINVWAINEMNLSSANSLNLTPVQRLSLADTFQKAIKRANSNASILNNSTALRYESNDNADFFNMLKSGAPADIVGLESYYSGICSNGYVMPQLTLNELSKLVDTYSTLGKKIYITELSVPSQQIAGSAWWQSQWNETTQAEYVENYYTLMFSKRYVQAITWGWGVLDSDSWTVSGGLLKNDKTPKAAYWTIKSLIDAWTTQGNTLASTTGKCTLRGFAGDYQVTVKTSRGTYTQTVHINEQTSTNITIKIR